MEHYDRQGNPIDMETFIRLHSSLNPDDYKRVAETTVGRLWISTVWLGTDHSFGGGPPMIFETMVFDQDQGTAQDLYCSRYSTEAEALAGHQEVLNTIMAGEFVDYNTDEVVDPTHVINEVPTLT